MTNYYYGFDISSSKIGIAIVDEDEKLIFDCVQKNDSEDSLEDRAKNFDESLIPIFEKYPPTKYCIETPLEAASKTTAHTIAILQRFNGMCSYILYKKTNMIPNMVSAITARNKQGIKIEKIRKKKKTAEDKRKVKETIIQFVSEKFPSFTYKITPKGNFQPGTDDRADAIVLALYAFKMFAPKKKNS